MCNVFDFGVENWNYGISANFVERNSLTNNCKSFIMNINLFSSGISPNISLNIKIKIKIERLW